MTQAANLGALGTNVNSSGKVSLASGATGVLPISSMPAGTVLQVATAYKTDVQAIPSGTSTFADITGLSVTLTPRSSSSKFLCIWSLGIGNGTDAATCYIRLNRNGTAIGLADAAGNRTLGSSIYINTAIGGEMIPSTNSFLDAPATSSAVTYKLTASSNNTSYINRSARDNDGTGYDGRATSSLTILEIAV